MESVIMAILLASACMMPKEAEFKVNAEPATQKLIIVYYDDGDAKSLHAFTTADSKGPVVFDKMEDAMNVAHVTADLHNFPVMIVPVVLPRVERK